MVLDGGPGIREELYALQKKGAQKVNLPCLVEE